MLLLIITTILWAFSFSLIGNYLAGQVDGTFSAFMRALLATSIFLPFLRWRGYPISTLFLYALVGMLQLGMMYLFSFEAYLYLTVPEFLLFTVMTPLYITLLYDLFCKRRPHVGYLLSASLAVIGAAIIRYDNLSDHFWKGLLLVQLANLCFAVGIVGYKRLQEKRPLPQHTAFAWFYVGALVILAFAWIIYGDKEKLPSTGLQWGVLLWLGAVASGLGYFMWNYGATQVDAGMLSIMNNMHVPAGLLVNLIIWQEQPHWTSFILGSLVICASLWIHKRWIVTN